MEDEDFFSCENELDGDDGKGDMDNFNNSPKAIEKNGYKYTMDNEGRVSMVEGDLRLKTGERDVIAQREAGGKFRRDTDEGGHFIGNRFDGFGGDINLFAQNSSFNRGGYKAMENEWAKELKKGNDVHVDIEPLYQHGIERPHVIMGDYIITKEGKETTEYFSFTNENLRSDEFNIDDYDFEFEKEEQ